MLLIGRDDVPYSVGHDILRLLQDGPPVPHNILEMRKYAADAFVEVLQQQRLPDLLVRVCCWSLGEYGIASGSFTAESLVTILSDALEKKRSGAFAFAAYMKQES